MHAAIVSALEQIEKTDIVPTEFAALVDRLVTDAELRQAIDKLLAAKRQANELDWGPRIEPISNFLDRELVRWEGHEPASAGKPLSSEPLDRLFRESLAELWQTGG